MLNSITWNQIWYHNIHERIRSWLLACKYSDYRIYRTLPTLVMLDINIVIESIWYQSWYKENETNNGIININNEFVINLNIYYFNNCCVWVDYIMKPTLVSLDTWTNSLMILSIGIFWIQNIYNITNIDYI